MKSSQSNGSKVKNFKGGVKKKKNTSWLRTIIEFMFFAVWLICTGFAGYFIGRTPSITKCDTSLTQSTDTNQLNRRKDQQYQQPLRSQQQVHDCEYDSNSGSGIALGAVDKPNGFTYNEILRMWKCSQISSFSSSSSPSSSSSSSSSDNNNNNNSSQTSRQIFPKQGKLDKTKWKSILSVEPKAFFQKYLTQYPADMKAVQPVVVFSHKPLNNFEEIADVCKVLDISIVPDSPEVCVAVTETYHDVASYHMLHADRQPDVKTFALTSNHIKERILPQENDYIAARALLLEYFNHVDYVTQIVKQCPRFSQNKVSVGCVVETLDELELFQNSLITASHQKINYSKICLFTTSQEVFQAIHENKLKVVYLSELQQVGRVIGESKINELFRTHFLQIWLAFALANNNHKILWQSPGTIWYDKPDIIITKAPITETLFSFKGRQDPRAAPFFVSFDFFTVTGNERAVHLMHELILNFDLVLGWKSLDAVLAYRLSENNARYGTTTFIWPPYHVLHVDLLAHNINEIKSAISTTTTTHSSSSSSFVLNRPKKDDNNNNNNNDNRPLAVVFPRQDRYGVSMAAETKKVLKDCNLWFL